MSQSGLSERQQRELDYHREHAKKHKDILAEPFSWEVLKDPRRRWWNAYWQMVSYLVASGVQGKQVLVMGCGFGEDALRLAKFGAQVSAFDLSPDSLRIARALAEREGLSIDFEEMPAEQLRYPDASFDFILCRDILHHVDIPEAMREIVRVAKPGAQVVINEIYSHSFTNKVRYSSFVESFLYPRMRSLIYGPGAPYITEDERKLTEKDLEQIGLSLQPIHFEKHFNLFATRIFPERMVFLAKVDRLLLMALKPFGRLLAGRIFFCARVAKPAVSTAFAPSLQARATG